MHCFSGHSRPFLVLQLMKKKNFFFVAVPQLATKKSSCDTILPVWIQMGLPICNVLCCDTICCDHTVFAI